MTVEEIEIIVTAKVNEALKDFKKLAPEIKKEIEKVRDVINNVEFKTIVKETEKASEIIKGKVENTKKAISGINKSFKPFHVKRIGLDEAKTSTRNLTEEQIRLKSEMSKVAELMRKQQRDSREYIELRNKLHLLNRQYQGLPIINVNNQNNSNWEDPKRKITGINKNFKPFIETSSNENSISLWDELKNKILEAKGYIEQCRNSISKIFSTGIEIQKINREIAKVNKEIDELDNPKSEGFFSKLINSVNIAINKIRGMTGITDKLKKSVNKVSSGFKGGLGTVLKYAGALFGISTIYSTLKSSASSWLSSSNAQAQQLSANIEYMRYALGSSFAPIIEYIVNLVYQLLKGIQSVVYALTKVNIFARATASSMNNASKSAGKASKSLSSVHSEINNVSSDNGSSSGDVSPNIDLSQMGDVSGSIFDAIKNGEWSSLGMLIAEKLNSALESIPWDKIKSTAKSIGTNVALFLNGFISETDWNLIGSTVAEGLNTAIYAVNGFVTTFDWSRTGYAIANAINGFTLNADWNTLANTISRGINGAVDIATSIIENTEWNELGQGIGKTIGRSVINIDWVNIGKLIVESFGSIKSVIAGIGQGIVDGIFEGIGERIGNLTIVKIAQLMFHPILDKFKQVWGIHSPSTVMAEMGTYIIQGLLNGISSLVGNIGEIWNTITSLMRSGAQNALSAIQNVFSGLASWFKTIFTNAWTTVKNVFSKGGQIFKGIKEGILSTFKTIVNGLIDGINTIVAAPFNAINKALTKIKNITIPVINEQPFKDKISTISVPQIPHLATGNVAYEETLGIFAEYSNARSNPEITTPQNIMADTFRKELQNYASSNQDTNTGLSKLILQFGSVQIGLEMDKLIRQARRQNGTATVII